MKGVMTLSLVFLLLAGCSSGLPEEAVTREEPSGLEVERLASGERGPEEEQVVATSSAAGLAAASGVEVPDAGEGVYLLVAGGQRPTGGYNVEVESAEKAGERVVLQVSVREPDPDEMVPQVLTRPYTVAVVRDLDPEGLDFSVVNAGGGPLGWPVVR